MFGQSTPRHFSLLLINLPTATVSLALAVTVATLREPSEAPAGDEPHYLPRGSDSDIH